MEVEPRELVLEELHGLSVLAQHRSPRPVAARAPDRLTAGASTTEGRHAIKEEKGHAV
jgi:hypothetical protein